MTQCVLHNCNYDQYSIGLCFKHFWRFKERHWMFWRKDKTEKHEPSKWLDWIISMPESADCIEWPYGRTGSHGQVCFNGYQIPAHRYSLTNFTGVAYPELVCAHNCGNSLCVNPYHLRWATQLENMADKKIHQTNVGMPNNLTPQQKLAAWKSQTQRRSRPGTRSAVANSRG